jgi:MOSC domain-containing protein YiiM
MTTSGDGVVEPGLISVQIGVPRTIGQADAIDPMDQVWMTGFFKEPVSGLVWLGRVNLAGDSQADLQNHGGPEKAVNVYPAEHYPYWERDLVLGALPFGAFGENFTTEGLLEADVCIGDVFGIGEAVVQLSQPRQPCWKLARRWRMKDLALKVQQTGRTGWYFRVLREGHVQVGAKLRLIERHHPEWTVAAANEVMHHRTKDLEAARSLAACLALSVRWRESLTRRVITGTLASTTARLEGAEE